MDTDQVKDKHKRKKDHIPTASKYMQQPGNTRKPGPSRKQMEKERYQNVTGVTAIPSQGQAAQDDNRPRPPTSPVSTESSSALHNAPPILPKQTRPLPRASRSRPAVTSEIRGKDPVKQAAGHLSASAKVKKRSHASIGIQTMMSRLLRRKRRILRLRSCSKALNVLFLSLLICTAPVKKIKLDSENQIPLMAHRTNANPQLCLGL